MAAPDGLRIDPAAPGDEAVVLRMIRLLADYEKLTRMVEATEESVRAALFGPRPAAEAAIARVSGGPVGFAVWCQNYSTFLSRPGLYLEDLFVLPEWRRHGIGRALLTHLARLAVERGYGRMEWSVLNWNEPAIGFYRRLGALPMDDWTVYRLAGDALARVADQTS